MRLIPPLTPLGWLTAAYIAAILFVGVVIFMGYPRNSCAQGVCYGVCWVGASCPGSNCSCLIPPGQTTGQCYGVTK